MTLTASPAPAMSPLSANLVCMASMLVWAVGLPAIEILLDKIDPLPLAALRLGMAGVVLVAIWLAVEGAQTVRTAPWLRGTLFGTVGFGAGVVLLIMAQARTDAVTVAVIAATMPVVGIGLECLLDGRRLTARLVAGLVLSLGGGLIAYAAKIGSLTLGVGAVAALGSVLCFTWASRATVAQLPGLTPLGRTAITVGGGAVVTVAAALIAAALGAPAPLWQDMGVPEWSALALYGLGSMALSQLLWIVAIGHLGIGIASLHGNAAPFYVMIFSLALGGAWNGLQALGAVIVVIGVVIAQGMGRRPAGR